jgi:hypothetical protein
MRGVASAVSVATLERLADAERDRDRHSKKGVRLFLERRGMR